jgi:putative flippase GtrA
VKEIAGEAVRISHAVTGEDWDLISRVTTLIRTLFKGQTNNTGVQLLRYLIVGGLAFVVDFTTLYLLHRVGGFHYLLAAALAFVLGVATNYAISILWVFGHRAVSNPLVELAVFVSLGVIGLGITELTLYLLTGLLGADVMLSKALATVITFAWNFVSRKFLLFPAPPARYEAAATGRA